MVRDLCAVWRRECKQRPLDGTCVDPMLDPVLAKVQRLSEPLHKAEDRAREDPQRLRIVLQPAL